MTSARQTGRALFYRAFYRLPHGVRNRLVRVFVPKYIVGGVTLVFDSERRGADDPGRMLLLRQPPGRSWGLPAGLLQRREPPVVGAAERAPAHDERQDGLLGSGAPVDERHQLVDD